MDEEIRLATLRANQLTLALQVEKTFFFLVLFLLLSCRVFEDANHTS